MPHLAMVDDEKQNDGTIALASKNLGESAVSKYLKRNHVPWRNIGLFKPLCLI